MAGVNALIAELRSEHERALREHEDTLAGLGRGEPKPPAPVCPSFLVTEPTIEGCFKAIGSGVGFLGWCTDEAAAFWGGHSMQKEQRMKTSGILSKFWDYASFSRPRASGEGDGYVPPVATTVNLMFQPELLAGVYGDDFLKGQGILARMLVAWPPSNMGTRLYRPNSVDDRAVVGEFERRTADALRACLTDQTRSTLALSDGARRICIAFHDAVEVELARGRWASDITGFASKAVEHACRLAALLTLYEGTDSVVSAEIMAGARDLVQYHLRQFKHLCIAAANELPVANAQVVLDWLRNRPRPGDAFATEHILQYGPVPVRKAKALNPALDVLVEHRWILPLPAGTVVDGKPRKRAYRIHPEA